MDEETGCFRDSQNENYVVKTTEFAEKPRGRCGQQMESCAGGGTLSKKCAKNANWTGAAALSPRRRGYAAKIMRRKNARRKFGKRGITLSESLRHHPQHTVDGNAAMVVLRRFFIIIILS